MNDTNVNETPKPLAPPQARTTRRPYSPPRLEEFGSVAKLTAAKTGSPTDAGMPMSSCL